MKRMKKQSRISSDGSVFEGPETFSSQSKRGETMEDIFGPISDSDSQMSMVDAHKTIKSNLSNAVHHHSIGKSSSTQPPLPPPPPTAATTASTAAAAPAHNQNENNIESKTVPATGSNMHHEKEKHREKRRERKRKEREKQHHQQSINSKDDDNSVDIDVAARALEAQLIAHSEQQKSEEISNETIFSNAKENSAKNLSYEPASASLDKPYDDVFRFSETEDGPDNIFLRKEDTHRSKDKKKKKKKSRESRHHHHHSSHSSSFISPPTTPGLSIDTDDLPLSKPPTPPLIVHAETKPIDRPAELSKNVEAKVDPIAQHPTTAKPHSAEDQRKDAKQVISGYGSQIDATIHNTAIQSISTDLAEKTEPEKTQVAVDVDKSEILENIDSATMDKNEEKSRVIISQEETEDAVAALLGESFDMSGTDYSFTEEPIVEEATNLPTSDNTIAEEEAEEMRKAVQSLNTEEIDMKPDTPQSDNGLQIDTDTEEPDESNALQIDESVRIDENKQPSPAKSIKKSPLKETKESGMAGNQLSNECKKGISKPDSIQSTADANKIVDIVQKLQETAAPTDEESKKTTAASNPISTVVVAAPTIIAAKPKPHIEPPILPPIIPKMASIDTPTDLLSVSISTPTLTNKSNIMHIPSISASAEKPTAKPATASKYCIFAYNPDWNSKQN